ncbi:alpha/beta fold hydrolase [Rugamonas apoptosis]|uniref:Alpha/beta fold hydrolase n=1 Tax=Rugamonas apoptosis TaxID=2758570 RepID=A0A7W2FF11_9BURK|nr:alpha/beta fold hydrolase [Rugamonas apoptosis]MBA5690471.1 alpha/beta fold hydrolase [Rugamonas apoptosis]
MPSIFASQLKRLAACALAKAIDYQTKAAKLRLVSVEMSFGTICYLDSIEQRAKHAILMLHGAGAEKESWLSLAQHLGQTRRIVIPDLPGHGNSSADLSLNYDISHQTSRVLAFMNRLDLEKVHLIANSMGGAIALRLASQHPDRLASLQLIDCAGAQSTPDTITAMFKDGTNNPLVAVRSLADFKLLMNTAMSKPPYIPGFFLAVLADRKISRASIDEKIYRDIARDLDQRAILERIAVPTSIIWGAEDRILSVEDAALLHEKIAGSEKLILEGLGHVPMVEAPKLLASHCLRFLNAL